jgi:hypothetical protein
MALTPTITKVSIDGSGLEGISVTLRLQVSDGVGNVIDKNYSVTYNTRTGSSAEAFEMLKKNMQEDIDAYKSAKVLDKSAQFTTDITALKNKLIM